MSGRPGGSRDQRLCKSLKTLDSGLASFAVESRGMTSGDLFRVSLSTRSHSDAILTIRM